MKKKCVYFNLLTWYNMVFGFTMPITTKVVSSIPAHGELTKLEVIYTDYQSNCKSNYHVISTTTAPERLEIKII